ncbi:hypothetical protein N7493_007354 [Penicillium malachiteum]|uniref:Uncharacterized protein n=1 Tax=Penicillium malachiteum TaxID=1324776 RepID=A0AAD6HJS6_9EURO|nr:hypothetical protein N7493_007354 [Penicillium malachiteum]
MIFFDVDCFWWKIEKMHQQYIPKFGSPNRESDFNGSDHTPWSASPSPSALSPFFLRKAILQQKPLILNKIDRLYTTFMVIATDIITKYAYVESSNYLNDNDFRLSWRGLFWYHRKLNSFEKFPLYVTHS